MILTSAVITMIACHGASADHFAVFAKQLSEERYEVRLDVRADFVNSFYDDR